MAENRKTERINDFIVNIQGLVIRLFNTLDDMYTAETVDSLAYINTIMQAETIKKMLRQVARLNATEVFLTNSEPENYEKLWKRDCDTWSKFHGVKYDCDEEGTEESDDSDELDNKLKVLNNNAVTECPYAD